MTRARQRHPPLSRTGQDNGGPEVFGRQMLEEGGYEIVRRDSSRREHEVTTTSSINDIAHDLTIWTAGRAFPGRPPRTVTDLNNTA